MQEKRFTIPLEKNKVLYATMTGEWENALIIFVHGLTGNMDEALPAAAADYFAEKGLSFLRFNLYDWQKDARTMRESDLNIHKKDLKAVIDCAIAKGSQDIYLIGHSLGAYTVLMSGNNDTLTGLLLWDPSHPDLGALSSSKLQYVPGINAYLMNAGISYVFSKRYVNSVEEFDIEPYVRKCQLPVFIANAADGILVEYGNDYEKRLKHVTNVKREVIEKADHSFSLAENKKALFNASHEWITALGVKRSKS